MRILVISDRLPFPAIGGIELRLSNLLRRVATQHEVWFVSFLDRPEKVEGLARMREL